MAASARTYAELEARLFSSNAIEGVALRYGFFYAPKTWYPARRVGGEHGKAPTGRW